MAEAIRKYVNPAVLLETIVGSEEWKKYRDSVKDGKFKDDEAQIKYLRGLVVRRYGKVLPDAELRKHDDRIEAKVERLFEKYLSMKTELAREKRKADNARTTKRRWHRHAKFMEDQFYKMLGDAIGYDKIFRETHGKEAEPFLQDRHGKRLKQDYITGLVEYIITNFVNASMNTEKVTELESQVETLKSEKQTLQTELDELKGNYAKLEKEVEVYRKGVKDAKDSVKDAKDKYKDKEGETNE